MIHGVIERPYVTCHAAGMEFISYPRRLPEVVVPVHGISESPYSRRLNHAQARRSRQRAPTGLQARRDRSTGSPTSTGATP